MSGFKLFGDIPEDISREEKQRLIDAWVRFICALRWDWFVTLTFVDNPHPERAERMFRRWVHMLNRKLYGPRAKLATGANVVRALERTKLGRVHFHLLVGGAGVDQERRLDWHDNWKEIGGGVNKVEAIRSSEKAATYCAKYVYKGGEIDLIGPMNNHGQRALPLTSKPPSGTNPGRSSERCGEAQLSPQTGAGDA